MHWVDLAWRVYCCPCIPIVFSSGLFTAWRAAERFYTETFGFLFDNISRVVFVFASSFLSIFAFILSAVDCVYFGLDSF